MLFGYSQTSSFVYFESDIFKLNENDKTELKDFLDKAQSNEVDKYYISGYTDTDGADNYNMKLSFRRVSAVYNFLLDNEIPPSKIQMDWKGERKPFAENNSDSGKQKNRCVELISSNENPQGFSHIESYHDLFNEDKIETQDFRGFSDKEIRIEGKKGTIITIPENSLVSASGEKYRGIVSIKLKEIYSTKDIIESNLQTLSNGRLIETGGMIKITVQGNNKDLFLGPGITAEVLMPTAKPAQNMQVFYGSLEDGQVEWETNNALEDLVSIKEISLKSEFENDTLSKELFNNFRLDISSVKTQKPTSSIIQPTPFYKLDIQGFNWINCDRFPTIMPLSNLVVEIKSSSVTKVVLIFEDMKSVMNGVIDRNLSMVSFSNIPKNEKAILMAVSVDNGSPLIQTREIIVGKERQITLFPEKTSSTEMEAAITALGL